MGFHLFLGLMFFILSPFSELVSAADVIVRGQSVSVNQTIISSGGIFVLGFFRPSNSTGKRYAGIWYNNIQPKTVVWVANRERPLLDPSGVLTIAGDGNIVVVDGERRILWSSNVSGLSINTTAVLLDNGNLVLQGEGSIWQSFDHPTDTLLPGMKVLSNFRTHAFNRLTAWRDAEDPFPGDCFLGLDPRRPLQLIVRKGSDDYARSQVWNGTELGSFRDASMLSVYVFSFEANDEGLNLTFSATVSSAPVRLKLDPTGWVMGILWNDTVKNWTVISSAPRPCDTYNRCGPSAICNDTGSSLMCDCLRGYEPTRQKEWNTGNFSGGCEKRVPFNCGQGDWFLRTGGLKLPDNFILVRNMRAMEECEAECLRRCNCTAYAHADVHSWVKGSRCLLWAGEMVDITQLTVRGQDLHVRLAASEQVIVKDQKSSNKDIPLLVVLPTLASAIFLIGIFYWLRRRSKRQALQSQKDTMDPQFLDFSSLVAATDNFSAANKLGEGGFGPVYKGRLPQGQDIAVKRLSQSSVQGSEEFKNEVELIAGLQHTNLVKLVAWCIHRDEKLLIYEYLPNKSLDKFIFDPTQSTELDWSKRTRIIEGIAQGLLYLHRYSRLRVIHRDLKTSNILLDDAMNPKISDFGLARKFGGNQTEANTKKIVGTIGYMPPEYALNGLFSEKSDVFSFGVIIIEVISGKRSTGFYLYDASLTLLGYAWRLWQEGKGLELVDSRIKRTVCEAEALRFIQVGLLCIQENSTDRPTMSSIISMLDNGHAVMPLPKHPAFSTGKDPNLIVGSSVNGITLSVLQGR